MEIDCVLVTSVVFHFWKARQGNFVNMSVCARLSANVLNVPLFDMRRYMTIIGKQVSIISNTCWG